jgi:hypothetical protein
MTVYDSLHSSSVFSSTVTNHERRISARSFYCLERRLSYESSYVKVKVTLRLTVSQSVCLGVEPHLGPMTRYLLQCDSYGLVLVGRPP